MMVTNKNKSGKSFLNFSLIVKAIKKMIQTGKLSMDINKKTYQRTKFKSFLLKNLTKSISNKNIFKREYENIKRCKSNYSNNKTRYALSMFLTYEESNNLKRNIEILWFKDIIYSLSDDKVNHLYILISSFIKANISILIYNNLNSQKENKNFKRKEINNLIRQIINRQKLFCINSEKYQINLGINTIINNYYFLVNSNKMRL